MPSPATATLMLKEPSDLDRLQRAWGIAADPDDVLFVITYGDVYLMEGPDERCDLPERVDHEESMLRLFSEYEDAVLYCEMQRENYKPAVEATREGKPQRSVEDFITVAKTTLTTLNTLLPTLQQRSFAEYDVPVRVDLCAMKKDEFPVSLDTVFSTTITPN